MLAKFLLSLLDPAFQISQEHSLHTTQVFYFQEQEENQRYFRNTAKSQVKSLWMSSTWFTLLILLYVLCMYPTLSFCTLFLWDRSPSPTRGRLAASSSQSSLHLSSPPRGTRITSTCVRKPGFFFFLNLGTGIQTQVFICLCTKLSYSRNYPCLSLHPVCESSATESSFLALSPDFLRMSSWKINWKIEVLYFYRNLRNGTINLWLSILSCCF